MVFVNQENGVIPSNFNKNMGGNLESN